MQRQRIAELSELTESHPVKFHFHREGLSIEGFVFRYEGKIVAYENLCRHLPLTLDYGDNRFFTEDGRHVICRTHGAVYEPLTGLCISGPCPGTRLRPLPIEISEGAVWLKL